MKYFKQCTDSSHASPDNSFSSTAVTAWAEKFV
uniref:Uncharacterized protein n=1 Tax=Arundo donax TaxID=35708 RepID=A0A0A8ZCT2_ARUDO